MQAKETCRQKRPIMQAKETYYAGKRDLLCRQKKPIMQAKETYYHFTHTHKET
jgi:hypothetical protein